MSNAYGLIHDYYPRERMISIKLENKLSFFYFPKNLYKIFYKSMTYKSVYIFFEYSDEYKVLKGAQAKLITNIEKIEYQSNKGKVVLYSQAKKKTTLPELFGDVAKLLVLKIIRVDDAPLLVGQRIYAAAYVARYLVRDKLAKRRGRGLVGNGLLEARRGRIAPA